MKSKKIFDEKIDKFFIQLIFELFLNDSFVIEFRKKLIISEEIDKAWADENDVLRHDDKFYVSKFFRTNVLKQCHDDSLTEHFEIRKILNLIQRRYYWSNRE